MGFFASLFGKQQQTGLPALLNLNTESASLSAALPDIFAEYFNSIAPDMLGRFRGNESLEALSKFAFVIIKLRILNSVCSSSTEQVANDIEKITGLSVACSLCQVDVINRYIETPTNNINTSKFQFYMKTQLDGCYSMLKKIRSEASVLGLESFIIYNINEFEKILREEKTVNYLENRIGIVLENQCV
ncbi:hypothetical protein SAMN02745220_04852 [Desulfopila aestuarii DSM 18488]|uniref:Uncharacterized protein n=2 Tax=Desulfopila aestuarii TaxID=231440 RepID=A0A1M7YK52_9BACT|nr:hypothetical protein SAMN02745220_04852 [Desulfopila aestuarii DSM 18488]